LARKPSGDNVNGFEVVLSDCSDIFKTLRFWEMLRQHLTTIWVDFDLPSCLESSPFKAKVDASNSSK
jgi:hypothetical protein